MNLKAFQYSAFMCHVSCIKPYLHTCVKLDNNDCAKRDHYRLLTGFLKGLCSEACDKRCIIKLLLNLYL